MLQHQDGGVIQEQNLQQQQKAQQERQFLNQEPNLTKTQNNWQFYTGCWSCGDMDHLRRDCPKNY